MNTQLSTIAIGDLTINDVGATAEQISAYCEETFMHKDEVFSSIKKDEQILSATTNGIIQATTADISLGNIINLSKKNATIQATNHAVAGSMGFCVLSADLEAGTMKLSGGVEVERILSSNLPATFSWTISVITYPNFVNITNVDSYGVVSAQFYELNAFESSALISDEATLVSLFNAGKNGLYSINNPLLGTHKMAFEAQHIEGGSTKAMQSYTHAEGWNTTADGRYSHAEGYNTFVGGLGAHAEGFETSAIAHRSHAEGTYTIANGQYASHAEGLCCYANGYASHAEGGVTRTEGKYSHAEGYGVSAIGQHSHAEGHATKANGENAHAEGYNTTALSIAHAEGISTTASGEASHAEGNASVASGTLSHAEGRIAKATGNYSHAEGNQTTASSESSHAEGEKTAASGPQSHAEGGYTIASGQRSHSEGWGAEATKIAAHAEGKYTKASGLQAHAEGLSTLASGSYAHAEGGQTSAVGIASHSEGNATLANGKFSHAAGVNAYAMASCSYVWNGQFDDSTPEYIYEVNRKGTFNINPVGGIDGFYIGDKSLASCLNEISNGAAGNYMLQSTFKSLSNEIGLSIASSSNPVATKTELTALSSNLTNTIDYLSREISAISTSYALSADVNSLVSQTSVAIVGESTDISSNDTINGAKAYADAQMSAMNAALSQKISTNSVISTFISQVQISNGLDEVELQTAVSALLELFYILSGNSK